MIGQRLFHFEIIEKLGEGGMGVVYKARDTHLDRSVAIKVLPPERVADPLRKARFVQEAKAASALSHPNIISIYDIASDAGRDFIVMEFVPGRTLDQLIPRKGMRLNEALKLAIQIADALARAHAAGIVHRDIKPANIMVDGHGLVKVLDFGLAKLVECGGPNDETATLGVKTDEGTIVGTAAYMSPEQAEGAPLDARSDIFSFGAVLYEMVTGLRAFQGNSRASVIAAIMRDDPPGAGQVVANLPRSVDRLIARCLRKDIECRSQSMAEIKLELEEMREDVQSGMNSAAGAPPPRRPQTLLWLLAGAAVVAAGAGGWWLIARNAAETPPKYKLRQITSGQGGATLPAVSPDGKYVVYSSERGGNPDLWIQPVKGGEPTQLTDSAIGEFWAKFSPDGTQVVFQRYNGLFVLPIVGGKERQLTDTGIAPEFSPDGLQVAYRTADPGWDYSVWAIRATGGTPRRLYTTRKAVTGPIWSPDGKMVLIGEGESATSGPIGKVALLLIPQDGGNPVPVRGSEELLKAIPFPYPKIWLGDTDRVIFGNWGPESHISYVRMSREGKILGKMVQLTYGTREHPGPSSRDGRVIPFSTGGTVTTIYSLPLDTARGVSQGKPKKILQWDGDALYPTVSRDGSKMVFIANRDGNYDLWYRDMQTGMERPLLASPNRETRGVISPDGTKVAFQRHEQGRPNCYWMPLPTGAETGFRTDCIALGSWTPDSAGILSIAKATGWEIYNVETGVKFPAIQDPKRIVSQFDVSPDGRWLAFVRAMKGPNPRQVLIAPIRPDRPAREDEWIPVSAESFNGLPMWSPDGNAIYYYQRDVERFGCLFMRRLDPASKRPVGDPVVVRHFHEDLRAAGLAGTALLPDRLYLSMFEVSGQVWLAERMQ